MVGSAVAAPFADGPASVTAPRRGRGRPRKADPPAAPLHHDHADADGPPPPHPKPKLGRKVRKPSKEAAAAAAPPSPGGGGATHASLSPRPHLRREDVAAVASDAPMRKPSPLKTRGSPSPSKRRTGTPRPATDSDGGSSGGGGGGSSSPSSAERHRSPHKAGGKASNLFSAAPPRGGRKAGRPKALAAGRAADEAAEAAAAAAAAEAAAAAAAAAEQQGREDSEEPLSPGTRLDEGLPLGIPSGLLPAAEMPPRDVLVNTEKRKLLLRRICEELEATMPEHLRISEEAFAREEGKTAHRAKRHFEADEESRPVTSKFIRRVLVLFYASRNQAESLRVELERGLRGGKRVEEWPDAIQCMHASYIVIDSLVRIGHRRVLKVLLGTLFWNVLDVLEWPPQIFGCKIRRSHRDQVRSIEDPDPMLTPLCQREDLARLHRVLYIQNTCLVRACDEVTYGMLHEYIETEKLRLLRNVIDSSYYSKGGGYNGGEEAGKECFLRRWEDEWAAAAFVADVHRRRNLLLAHLLAVTTSAWEHDKTAPFTTKLQTTGVFETLVEALESPPVAAAAAEVLALLASDTAALDDTKEVLLGKEHDMRVQRWKSYLQATTGEGSMPIREMVQSLLEHSSSLWDVMMYLEALEDLVRGGMLRSNPERVRCFCESWNLNLRALERVLKEPYAGKVAAAVVIELSEWVRGTFHRNNAPMVASVMRTFTLLLRVPCLEAVAAIRRLQVFENLVGFIPKRQGLLQSACLSLCRAVWWRAETDNEDENGNGGSVHCAPDIGVYATDDSQGEDMPVDPRTALIPPATYLLTKLGLSDLFWSVLQDSKTLCPEKHPKESIRTFFSEKTHYE